MDDQRSIAYFSMEIALDPSIPTYSGGLGVLAGDTVRSAADLEVPLVAVTILPRKGYLRQSLDADGGQEDEPIKWRPVKPLRRLAERIQVKVEGRAVWVGAWRFDVVGLSGFRVPVILLDTDVPENTKSLRSITHRLYGGDDRYRLKQEAVLGLGGIRMLRGLGLDGIERFHMNEGHASLLVLELLRETAARIRSTPTSPEVVDAVRTMCVFTTHTPVEAGHDRFPMTLAKEVVDPKLLKPYLEVDGTDDPARAKNELNMTSLGFRFSTYINGVAKRHGEFSRQLFTGYTIRSITNGVHAGTWVSPPLAALFDDNIPDWRKDAYSLRSALAIRLPAIRAAHQEAKRDFIAHTNELMNVKLDPEAFTIGFARRATAYKRADLILSDPKRLRAIAKKVGPIQLVFGGKAHPKDEEGKSIIRAIVKALKKLGPHVRGTYLPNYEWELCAKMVAGCDLWLNTPKPPMEASGTSGMKAALNGVPSFSVPDGWWVEGCIEGVTGWAIGEDIFAGGASTQEPDVEAEIESMYDKLERIILPMYYKKPDRYVNVMRHSIAINGAFFHTQRMMMEYVAHAYL